MPSCVKSGLIKAVTQPAHDATDDDLTGREEHNFEYNVALDLFLSCFVGVDRPGFKFDLDGLNGFL